MDFTVRASNREAYVAPDRGQQGNALKTILPMPVVVDPVHGKLVVTAHGKRHVITCGADPISQRAIVNDDVTPAAKCKNSRLRRVDKSSFIGGTEVRIEWSARNDSGGDVLWPFDDLAVLWEGWPPPTFSDQFRAIVEGFAVFNPHATISLDWFGKKTTWDAADPNWRKWKPHQPTSPHWYETPHLERLIGAYVTHDRENGSDRLVLLCGSLLPMQWDTW